jgi:enoyl-CoA hydratase
MPPGCDGLPMSRIAIRATEFMSNVVPAMRRIPQPIVVAVNGPAYGGGLCLMLGADIRLAAESARFCSAGIRNGLTATELGVSWLLPRLVGAAHAWDILLTTREVDGRMRDSNSVPPLVEMWHGPVREAPPRTGPCKTREQIVPAVACADD